MRTTFALIIVWGFGIYCGSAVVDRLGYAAGFDKGYADGIKQANQIIAGIEG